jgi:glycosyltransferase involved in cell wall biosynthesis
MVSQKKTLLDITVILAVKNEALNLSRCLSALTPVKQVIIIDSKSTDQTIKIAKSLGTKLIQFKYKGGYPKKRQWALENINFKTKWIFFLDADEFVTEKLWDEIKRNINMEESLDAYLITKEFHFLGKKFYFGGFSHSAVLLFKNGKAHFEKLIKDNVDGLDIEVHERLIVDGKIGKISTPLIHQDFKGLEAYIQRHNKYSTWEAQLRFNFLNTGKYGQETIVPRFFGNSQERRRSIKKIVIHFPFESLIWFFYHYIFRLGFLEGRAGLIASQIRYSYICQVRAKVYELLLSYKKSR